jgi:hypothetical protein
MFSRTAAPTLPSTTLGDPARKRSARLPGPADRGQALHYKVLEGNKAIFAAQRGKPRPPTRALRTVAPPSVGAQITLKVPDLNSADYCKNYFTITARVAYVGTKSIVVEDITNPVRNIDTTYAQIGTEFDTLMYNILKTNFGDPLVMDANLDNNGREIMVFTHVVNDNFTTLAGFVGACDFYSATTYPSSNFGEYFYAIAPTVSGNFSVTDSPPEWRWGIRGTIIHESKHIVSFAAHVSGSASVFEDSWLEESMARIAEELYERSRYSFTQKSNIGYGSAASQVGPYCGVRACNQNPRGFVRVFEALQGKSATSGGIGWFQAMEDHSPLGRLDANDFSFYATGWSLVRWAMDNSSLSESGFLTGITQEKSVSGVANLQIRAGRVFSDMLPLWSMATVLDDYPGFTPLDSKVKQPSWNFRNVMSGLNSDFPSTYTSAWPLITFTRSFGNWADLDYHVLPGTTSMVELSGSQTAKQMIELKAGGTSTANAPASLRIAIVRVQ